MADDALNTCVVEVGRSLRGGQHEARVEDPKLAQVCERVPSFGSYNAHNDSGVASREREKDSRNPIVRHTSHLRQTAAGTQAQLSRVTEETLYALEDDKNKINSHRIQSCKQPEGCVFERGSIIRERLRGKPCAHTVVRDESVHASGMGAWAEYKHPKNEPATNPPACAHLH